jgi:Protein of unknown function (DUF3574)
MGIRHLRLVALLAAAAACAATMAPALASACPEGLRTANTAQLFFGRSIESSGAVTDADWRAFLDAEVSPRFPDGLSVSDVYGQWKSPAGDFVREDSKALFIVLAGRPDERQRLDLIRDAYKRRFHQQSVLLVEQKACVAF